MRRLHWSSNSPEREVQLTTNPRISPPFASQRQHQNCSRLRLFAQGRWHNTAVTSLPSIYPSIHPSIHPQRHHLFQTKDGKVSFHQRQHHFSQRTTVFPWTHSATLCLTGRWWQCSSTTVPQSCFISSAAIAWLAVPYHKADYTCCMLLHCVLCLRFSVFEQGLVSVRDVLGG